MKSFKKSLLAICAVLILVFSLTGCTKSSSTIESETKQSIEDYTLNNIKNQLDTGICTVFTGYTYDEYASAINSGSTLVSIPYDTDLGIRWLSFVQEHGEVQEAYTQGVDKDGDNYNAYIVLKGEDGQLMRLTIKLSSSGTPISNQLESYSDDSAETLGSKLAGAATNTLSGLLVVFFALAFLCILISCLKYVNVIGKKKEEKPAPAPVVKPAPAPQVQAPAVQETDDKELIAVIAAAIAASEGTTPDGFVVRSIKRLNNNKW